MVDLRAEGFSPSSCWWLQALVCPRRVPSLAHEVLSACGMAMPLPSEQRSLFP